MNKIIFGGICMFVSIIGIATIISGIFTFEWQVAFQGMPFLLEQLRLTYLYDVFYWLGIIGFILGTWGIFEKK